MRRAPPIRRRAARQRRGTAPAGVPPSEVRPGDPEVGEAARRQLECGGGSARQRALGRGPRDGYRSTRSTRETTLSACAPCAPRGSRAKRVVRQRRARVLAQARRDEAEHRGVVARRSISSDGVSATIRGVEGHPRSLLLEEVRRMRVSVLVAGRPGLRGRCRRRPVVLPDPRRGLLARAAHDVQGSPPRTPWTERARRRASREPSRIQLSIRRSSRSLHPVFVAPTSADARLIATNVPTSMAPPLRTARAALGVATRRQNVSAPRARRATRPAYTSRAAGSVTCPGSAVGTSRPSSTLPFRARPVARSREAGSRGARPRDRRASTSLVRGV